MKNLKKVLSLALAGVMLVGMMAVSASAVDASDFSDAEDITHTEAVNVMATLGVLKGNDDGSFAPGRVVTRGEMAKIVCVMLNGGVEPTVGSSSAAMFTDTADHWARAYIEYCANLGIIAGRGDGTFAPNDPVTGAAAAKMLLVAAGYKPNVFEFEGTVDWELNVNYIANEKGLYDVIKTIDTSKGLSRDNTAQMAYNTLNIKVMTTDYTEGKTTGELSFNYKESNQTFLNKYFGALTFVGTFDNNDKTDTSLNKGSIQVKGDLDTADTSGEKYEAKTATFPADLDIANLGEEVKVIFKDGKSGTKNVPDKNDTIYGVFNTGATEVVKATTGDVKDNKSGKAQINVGGTKYSTEDEVEVYSNYIIGDVAKQKATDGDSNKNSSLTNALKRASGDAIKLLLRDGKVYRVYVTNSKLAVVTSKNATKVTLNNGVGTLTIKDHDIYDGIAVDDVVVVTPLYAEKAADAYVIVKKAEKVTGEITGYKDKTNVTVDGTTYKVTLKNDALFSNGISKAAEGFEDKHIGEDFDLYLVNGYVAAAKQVSESASNYSVVLEVSDSEATAGSTFNGLRLRVMDAAGAKSVINVSSDSVKKKGEDYNRGTIITYTLNKDGEAEVTIVADYTNPKDEAASYKKSTKSFNDVVTAADCVLFATTKTADGKTSDIKAYKIRALGDITAGAQKWVSYEKGGKTVAVFVDLGARPSGATSTTVYGIVSSYKGTVKVDGTAYKQFIVDSNGEKYTVNISTSNDALKAGQVVSFEPTADNTYGANDVKEVQASNTVILGYVDSYDKTDKIITVFTALQGLDKDGKDTDDADAIVSYKGKDNTRKTYAIDSDVDIYYVDADGKSGVESGSISKFDTVTGYANIVLVLDNTTNQNVTVMIVEVGGEKAISIKK